MCSRIISGDKQKLLVCFKATAKNIETNFLCFGVSRIGAIKMAFEDTGIYGLRAGEDRIVHARL
jgi:hypothetical protein